MVAPFRIDGGGTALVFAGVPHGPLLAYAGEGLAPDTDLDALVAAVATGPRENRPDDGADLLTVLPQPGWGFGGEPAVQLDRPARFESAGHEATADAVTFRFRDPLLGLALTLEWGFVPSGLLVTRASLANHGDARVGLLWLAALALPLPSWATRAVETGGRWGGEFAWHEAPLSTGRVEKAARGGRTGFDGAAFAIATDGAAREETGRIVAAHLAWSGNARHFIETLSSGERQLQIGERLEPGEATLAPGEVYATPPALTSFGADGLNGVRRRFHAELRDRSPPLAGPRRVHFNSWEAVYFDLSEPTLLDLADAAADIGAERFVLDDGWFRGRRDDRTSLGDWTVDRHVFPNGLHPLIERVRARGLDFGLWVEPEMVSPDSELHRAHPDWCLHAAGRPRPTQRGQLALDLGRGEVRDHLFVSLDRLLRDHAIAYLKWDHNRDLFPVGSARAQALGFYELVDRLRAAHPRVEIESCASGGGRIDFGVLSRAARVWASDNTDAVERLRLHRAMSVFLPPEVIGAHVGASPNPTTGRRLGMAFRARAALFAHLGVEADPRRMTDRERETLRRHLELYKRHRALIHGGRQSLIDTDDTGVTAQIVVAPDRREALALLARVDQAVAGAAAPVRLPGLDPAARYRVTLPEPWPGRAARQLADPDRWRAGPILSGEALARAGLRLPLVHPETAWLVHLEQVL